MSAKPWGLMGRPYLDLSPFLDASAVAALDREILGGLAQVETGATGATLKWMGVVAPWMQHDGHRDAMEAIRAMDADDFEQFVALGDTDVDLAQQAALEFGDETDHPFTAAQVRLLQFRHGVYFPWKVCHHLLENDRWEDKHSGAGKDFSDAAREHFPGTVAFVESLPFVEIGRCVIFGLMPGDHAPLHRDTEPGALQVAQSITFAPRPGKRLYLQNAPDAEPVIVQAPLYWFNDMDYHGVLADPTFRYSVRVDGVFEPDFVRALERAARATRSSG